ncbi:hypothetical protein TSUD_361030 [Trifolium subterraneum]|uniref:RNase H type-1 domain-containing protein n=1 Tax=Trifolium subterraneum TaxID=3900 RepID=A0A2Z6MXV0_TRISU|nr:hypothetical protein TSUD_361030 [Trifolium subterraneum]
MLENCLRIDGESKELVLVLAVACRARVPMRSAVLATAVVAASVVGASRASLLRGARMREPIYRNRDFGRIRELSNSCNSCEENFIVIKNFIDSGTERAVLPPDVAVSIIKLLWKIKLSVHKDFRWIGWEVPEEGWVKVNTDGASKGEGLAGCGGIIRDHRGSWCGGFAKFVGTGSAIIAELWGVLEGLKLAERRRFRNIEVNVDSSSVVKMIMNGESIVALWDFH